MSAGKDDVDEHRSQSGSGTHDHGHAGGHDHAHDHAGHHHDHAGPSHDHGHSHDHAGHSHDHRGMPAKRLAIALALTGGFMLVEAGAGLWSGSLALLSDAGHMLSDAGSLALALAAQRVADRPRTRSHTFGFRRAETLAALANAAALMATGLFVSFEAIRRLGSSEPRDVPGLAVLVVAALGLAINVVSAFVLAGGSKDNANVRAAFAHVVSDAAGSVAAMIAGAAIAFGGWSWADPVASLAIAALVVVGAVRLVKETAAVLMESTPSGLDLQALETTIRETRGVADFHDLHAWRIEEGFDAVTVHVLLAPGAHGVEVADEVALRIRKQHGVEHVTVQPEARGVDPIVPVSALVRDRR